MPRIRKACDDCGKRKIRYTKRAQGDKPHPQTKKWPAAILKLCRSCNALAKMKRNAA